MKKNEGAGALLRVRGGEPTRHPSIHLLLTAVLLTPDRGRGAAADRPSNRWVKGRAAAPAAQPLQLSSASVASPLDGTT